MSNHLDLDLQPFVDVNGRLGRPVPAGQIVIPQKVWLHDSSIRWRMGKRPQMREVSRTMLNRFVRLTDAKSILSFAKEWGVLAISRDLSSSREWCYRPPGQEMKEGSDPISAWQYYAKRARAVLNIAAALKRGRLGEMSDWDEFVMFVSNRSSMPDAVKWFYRALDRHVFGLGFSFITYQVDPEERLRNARRALASEVSLWLDCWKGGRTGRVSDFALYWNDDQRRWDLQIDYHGLLFAAIALQLALVVADADSLFFCSGCALPYIRPRGRKRPKSGWANYCDECCADGVAKRRAVERYRKKRLEAIRLHSRGAPISEIAKKLNTNTARLRGWVEKKGKDAGATARKEP